MAGYERAPRHIVEARYVGDYHVWLQFNNGRKGLSILPMIPRSDIGTAPRSPRIRTALSRPRSRDDRLGALRCFHTRVPL